MPARRFRPPWSVEEYNDACFIVRDHNGQQLAYVYFEDEPTRYIDSINAHSASGLRIMVQRFFNSIMP